MEARKITVVTTTNSQNKKVFMSAATTLGELKADLDAQNVDYRNMDFYEGVSKTKLLKDESVLPTNIPYKGTVTNELVFMLSTTNKKITSGAASTRPALYARIKELGLQEEIIEEFGRNFTQVPTRDLEEFISDYDESPNQAGEQAGEQEGDLEGAFRQLVEYLEESEVITESEAEHVLEILGENAPAPVRVPHIESSYEDEEIDELFDSLI